jgi:GxxExxY protein
MARIIFHKELSYQLTGLFFKIHKRLGRYCREKQYGDFLEALLKKEGIRYIREKSLPIEVIDNVRTNIVDFDIDGKILVDLKAKPFVTKEDYFQMQKYLQVSNYKLGMIVNFRSSYLKPIRIIRMNS